MAESLACFVMQPRSTLHWTMLAALIAAVTSCSTIQNEEEAKARVIKINESRRDKSLADWKSATIKGSDVHVYAERRTFLVIGGEPALQTSKITEDAQSVSVELDFRSRSDSPISGGGIAAITKDGYFLTAAHCVKATPLTIFVFNDQGKIVQTKGRVVWNGADEEPDLALIHAPVRPYATFPLADWDLIEPKSPIFTSGFGISFGSQEQSKSGGRILRINPVGPAADNAKWIEFDHDAPLTGGDSGGPVINREGQLLGINSSVTWVEWGIFRLLGRDRLWFYRCTAISPDPKWICELIAKDRAQQRAKP